LKINYLDAELSRYHLKTIILAAKLRGTNSIDIRDTIKLRKTVITTNTEPLTNAIANAGLFASLMRSLR